MALSCGYNTYERIKVKSYCLMERGAARHLLATTRASSPTSRPISCRAGCCGNELIWNSQRNQCRLVFRAAPCHRQLLRHVIGRHCPVDHANGGDLPTYDLDCGSGMRQNAPK